MFVHPPHTVINVRDWKANDLSHLGLSGAKQFLRGSVWKKIVQVAQDHPVGKDMILVETLGELEVQMVFTILYKRFMTFDEILRHDPVTPDDLAKLEKCAEHIGHCWRAMQWTVTPWIHFMVNHVCEFVELHGTYVNFISTVAEARHSGWKLDMKNAWLGWRKNMPMATRAGLAHTHRLDGVGMKMMVMGLDLFQVGAEAAGTPDMEALQRATWKWTGNNNRKRRKTTAQARGIQRRLGQAVGSPHDIPVGGEDDDGMILRWPVP